MLRLLGLAFSAYASSWGCAAKQLMPRPVPGSSLCMGSWHDSHLTHPTGAIRAAGRQAAGVSSQRLCIQWARATMQSSAAHLTAAVHILQPEAIATD